MAGCTDGQIDGQTDNWMGAEGQTSSQIDRWTDEQTDGWRDRLMDGRRTDG